MGQSKLLKSLIEYYQLAPFEDTIAVDKVNQYPITINSMNNNKKVMNVRFPLPAEDYAKSKEMLEEALKEVGIKRVGYRKGVILITLSNPRKSIEQYGVIRNFVGSHYPSSLHSISCPYCAQTQTDCLILKDDLYLPSHQKCQKEAFLKEKETIHSGNLQPGAYVMGVLGAIAGAILPMLLAFILLVLTNTSYGWLYVLSPYVAVMGYKKVKGPYGKLANIIILISCLLSFVIFLYAYCAYSLHNNGFEYLTLISKLRFSSTIIFSANYFELFWFETLFFLIGMVLIWFGQPFSKKKNAKQQEAREELTSSIVL